MFLKHISNIRFYNHITHLYLQKPRKLKKTSSHKIRYHFWKLRKAVSVTESTLNHFTSHKISPSIQTDC